MPLGDSLSKSYAKWDALDSSGEDSDEEPKIKAPSKETKKAATFVKSKKMEPMLRGMQEHSREFETPTAWAKGLTAAEQYETLIRCYWTRLMDVETLTGKPKSLVDPKATANDICLDFVVFCRLAAQTRAIPKDFDWAAFLQAAPVHFQTKPEPDPSLRFTASSIYIGGAAEPTTVEKRAHDTCGLAFPIPAGPGPDVVFQPVGGTPAWKGLVKAVAALRESS